MWQLMDMLYAHKKQMVAAEDALPGRDRYAYPLRRGHLVLGTDMLGPEAPEEPLPWPADSEQVILAGGCFWGIERVAWEVPGVHTTSAGYAGGFTPYPTYEEVFSAETGHTEAVRVLYRGSDQASRDAVLRELLRRFWEQHDPTTAMRQGNDVGTEYRSAVYWRRARSSVRAPRATSRISTPPAEARSPRSCCLWPMPGAVATSRPNRSISSTSPRTLVAIATTVSTGSPAASRERCVALHRFFRPPQVDPSGRGAVILSR
jgi:peptide-methionine (S)-S-oxide reductase